jgi:Lar family restriction alleviation protein
MSELKPCPFCGSLALMFSPQDDDEEGWCVVCQEPGCGCNARILYCHSEREAVDQWNHRAPNPLLPLVKELREVLRHASRELHYEPSILARMGTIAVVDAALARVDKTLEEEKR